MSAPSMKSLVTSTLALSICLAPFNSMAEQLVHKEVSIKDQVTAAAGHTLDQVQKETDAFAASARQTFEQIQKESDAQIAKTWSQYAATEMAIFDMKAAKLYSQALSNIDDPTLRMAVNGSTYVVVVTATTWEAWKALSRIGKIPTLIMAKPGVGTAITAVGGAAVRAAAVSGVVYALWHTNKVLLLEKQDYNELLMRLEADSITLQKQLGLLAKSNLIKNAPGAATTPGAPANSELFKIE